MAYIELHTSSAFSFLDGASLPETLISRAAELGYPSVALLDRDGVYGAPQFYRAARAAGLKAIVGAELTVSSNFKVLSSKLRDSDSARAAGVPPSEVRTSKLELGSCPWTLPILVSSAEGYRHLCRVISL